MLKRVVLLHHPQSEGAAALAGQAARELGRHGVSTRVADVWDLTIHDDVQRADLVICVGGDGTVLRAARLAVPQSPPVLGVNMGRLGFLTELTPRDLFNRFERIMAQDWRIEERAMVSGEIIEPSGRMSGPYDALNDIVVSRQAPGRPIYVDVRIDRAKVANYRCDGIIVATPTGSTGYSLSAGGPILAPNEHHLVLTPVAAHLALGRSIVLDSDSVIDLLVTSDHGAVLSVDGQEDVPIMSGARVTVRMSEHVTRFVTFHDPSSFFAELAERFEFQLSSAMNRRA